MNASSGEDATGTRDIDLLAIGLTTLDIALRPVDVLPAVDDGALVPDIRLSPAGTAGGTAAVAARLGLRVAIASAVGADLQGDAVRIGLEREGVDTALLDTSAQWPTSTTVIPVREDGQRSNLHMIGASLFAPVPQAAFDLLPRVRAVHWGAVGCPGPYGDGPDFLARARAAGALVTCDLISPQASALDELARLLPHVDVFMPSVAEVRFLAQTDDLAEAAARFRAMGAGACVFKLGRAGAAMFSADGEVRVPAFAIEPVDTTTCGDSFCAGFIGARLAGQRDIDALRFATAVAAQVAMGVGTFGVLRGFEETMAFAANTGTAG